MRNLFTIFAALLLTTIVFAQSPEKMSYQAVIRNSSDALVTNTQTGMQISILQGTVYGAAIYVETQTPTTNANGLVSVEIGDGTVLNGDFSTIDWSNGPYYIKTETDPAGGANYSITGVSQLLSVPYALHAKTAEIFIEADPIFSASEAVNITANDITNLGNLTGANTGDQDISGIATNEKAIQDTASQIRADIPDVNGFLTSEADPVFTAWDKSTGVSITESQISDLDHFTTADETDPAVAANFDFTGAANGDLLQFNGKRWVKVTPDYISDYTVTETDVTAHKAALTVTESQISDLGTYIETETDPTVTTYSVGDFAHGGIVFWVDETGQHGLVAAKADLDGGSGILWNNGTYTDTEAHGDGVYAGEMNTILIIANQGSNSNSYAAGLCANYTVVESGVTYGDWYLPSKVELSLLYQNKAAINATAVTNGGSYFASAFFWSSTESSNTGVWVHDLYYGDQKLFSKDGTQRVRAVRAF